jgi:hypothetical protein
MTEIIIYANGTACVNGRYVNDGKSILGKLHLIQPVARNWPEAENPVVHRHMYAVIKIWPVPPRTMQRRLKLGMRRSGVLKLSRQETQRRNERIAREFCRLTAEGKSKIEAAAMLAQTYGFSNEYVKFILRQNLVY